MSVPNPPPTAPKYVLHFRSHCICIRTSSLKIQIESVENPDNFLYFSNYKDSVAFRILFLRKVVGSLSILSQLSSRNFQIEKVEDV